MAKKVIKSKSLPEPKAPYSMATMAGNTMYISGLVALDKQGEVLGKGDIVAQIRRILEIMKELVAVEGGELSDVTKTTVYLTSFENYSEMNNVYREFFPAEPPARATVKTELVNPDFLVEVDAIAVIERT
jgi:aminoacrylate peracid reductase